MYTILGMGIQSKAIIKYLLDYTNEAIETYDSVKDVEPTSPRWTHHKTNYEKIFSYSGGHRVVISCLPTKYNPELANACAARAWGYVDLGGKLSDTEKLIELCNKNPPNSPIVPDCGVAPGLVSSVAGTAARQGYESVKIYCGGLPLYPAKNFGGYALAFNAEGLYKEYTGVAELRRGGELVYEPTLSRMETPDIEVGIESVDFEASPTSGSLSLSPRISTLRDLDYLTLRYTGHYRFLKNSILWQPDPIGVMEKVFRPIGPENPDILILKWCLFSKLKGYSEQTYVWTYDKENDITAMAQATGYTVAAVAQMIHNNELPTGIIMMDDIELDVLMERIQAASGPCLSAVVL